MVVQQSKTSIIACLHDHAATQPDALALRFLEKGEEETERLTYAELLERTGRAAAGLRERYPAGARILLCFDTGPEFVLAFLGCMASELIPVPVAMPRSPRYLDRLALIVGDSDASALVSGAAEARKLLAMKGAAALFSNIAVHVLGELASGPDEGVRLPQSSETAFIQYTSGSTGAPRGVVVGHDNLMANLQQIEDCFESDRSTRTLSWLPIFHDMGLIGTLLEPLYLGGEATFLPPLAFVQRPVRWLKAISRYRAMASGGPNFGFEHCLNRIDPADLAGVDLSSWSIAFNGSEPVRAATLRAFADRFSSSGFSIDSFLPCYGLAEATLLVCGKRASAPVRIDEFDAAGLATGAGRAPADGEADGGVSMVAMGLPASGVKVTVVDEAGASVPDGQIGEIIVSGGNVARGYWGNTEETRRAFGPRDEAAWSIGELRTGDLGMLHDGELYVIGRLKDLIIVRGMNIYPSDVEAASGISHSLVMPTRSAAFSVQTADGESFVVLQEVSRNPKSEDEAMQVIGGIRRAVMDEVGIAPADIALLRPGMIPTTTSGKIRRAAARADYLAGKYVPLASSQAPEARSHDGAS